MGLLGKRTAKSGPPAPEPPAEPVILQRIADEMAAKVAAETAVKEAAAQKEAENLKKRIRELEEGEKKNLQQIKELKKIGAEEKARSETKVNKLTDEYARMTKECGDAKQERDEVKRNREEVKREWEQAKEELRTVQQQLRDMQQRAEYAEQICRLRDASIHELRKIVSAYDGEKASRDAIGYNERAVQAEVPRDCWALDVGVQAVRLAKDQMSQTPSEAPKPRRHSNSLSKSCQTLMARRRPLLGEQNTQTEVISDLERTRSWPRGSVELAVACQTNFLDLSRNLRKMLAKDTIVRPHEVPYWLREERDNELNTLRRVLG